MSLNGLDDVKVKEAHDAAVAEPGGWFLLKYASRDEVDILGRGNGGIVEVRNAIAQFEEESPLFGYLRYRRRNVLIKYVPENCSRLIQARVAVHFNAVTERFSPHDTVFSMSSAKELKDTTLSAACSLHTASGSTSSSTSSLRRRRLMEIAEDAEEDERKRQSTVLEERSSRPSTARESSGAAVQSSLSTYPPPPAVLPSDQHAISQSEDSNHILPSRPSESRPRSPTRSIDGRRQSSQSTRPDMYSYSSYGSNGKPKVKLGPRPSLEMSGRPHTSGSTSIHRPISTLPAGLKLFSRGSKRSKERPASQFHHVPPAMILSPPPLPGLSTSSDRSLASLGPPTTLERPTSSSGSSIKAPPSPGFAPKTPTMTPEKARLMKALQMRKKQLSTPAPEIVAPVSLAPEPTSTIPLDSQEQHSVSAPKEVEDSLSILQDMAKADSGVVVDDHLASDIAESDVTMMSSNPASPMAPSEEAPSTQASSISDSTDETIQEADHELKSPVLDQDEPTRTTATEISDHETTPSAETNEQVGYEVYPKTLTSKPEVVASVSGFAMDAESEKDDNDNEAQVHEAFTTPPPHDGGEVEAPSAEEPIVAKKLGPATEDEETALSEGLQEEDETQVKKTPVRIPQVTRTPPREMKIPRSKFSVQDLKAKGAIKDDDLESSERPTTGDMDQTLPIVPKSPVGSTFSEDTKRSLTEDSREKALDDQTRKKRKGVVEPIRTDISVTDASGHNSENEFLSDDDLMDELQSATVQEAHPISVSKSPISSVFPTSPRKKVGVENRFSRVFSNPLWKSGTNNQMLSPSPSPSQESQALPTRSVSASAAYLNRINQQQAVPLAKKVNLGSGISQRIKALEKLNGLTATPVTIPGPTASVSGPSPAFFSVRKGNVRGGSRSPSIAERANSLTRNTPSPSASRDSSPEAFKLRERSGSTQSRLGAFASLASDQPFQARPESISVTARIIRDPGQPFPQKPEAGVDPLPLDLKQSPLVIDHQKAIVAPKETIQERRLSNPPKDVKKERRSSITMVKDLINERRSSFAERRKSMTIDLPAPSSARSTSRPPSTHTNSPSIGRPLSVSSKRSISSRDNNRSLSPPATAQVQPVTSVTDDAPDKKSGGRTTRMLRRMSSSLSAGRKTLAHAISPTVREESEPSISSMPSPPQSSLRPATVVEVGDVNVQFPDTLLWKRRSVRLDSQGFLVLNQAQGIKGIEKSAVAKRYHLSEFRLPFVPDMELQEMPNSVVLDFVEGGGLQIACEDRLGQQRVLQLLQESHHSWAAYGQ